MISYAQARGIHGMPWDMFYVARWGVGGTVTWNIDTTDSIAKIVGLDIVRAKCLCFYS